MDMILRILGNAAGATGVVLCIAAGTLRLGGQFYLAGVATGTLFDIGMGVMVFACLVKLQQLTIQRSAS